MIHSVRLHHRLSFIGSVTPLTLRDYRREGRRADPSPPAAVGAIAAATAAATCPPPAPLSDTSAAITGVYKAARALADDSTSWSVSGSDATTHLYTLHLFLSAPGIHFFVHFRTRPSSTWACDRAASLCPLVDIRLGTRRARVLSAR
eukprot:CAMPEP_0181391318 /NCGR_PEP_ID=MMETSP1106-20121128/25970_1 /TAXON_ID=81844 /ORGANISM="Mantoniella antarctica, Strain SL-175" /LENGTH=146 /DNA_ID=CAMNT_0023512319 /DNA_START=75 /DNA_END=512 /DNA_ORIENTATION=-